MTILPPHWTSPHHPTITLPGTSTPVIIIDTEMRFSLVRLRERVGCVLRCFGGSGGLVGRNCLGRVRIFRVGFVDGFLGVLKGVERGLRSGKMPNGHDGWMDKPPLVVVDGRVLLEIGGLRMFGARDVRTRLVP